MAIRIYPRIPATLPPAGAVLREPYARGLVCAFAPIAGGLTDLVSGLSLSPSNNASLSTGGGTAGLVCSANTACAKIVCPAWLKLAVPFTLVARVSALGTPSTNSMFFGVTANNTDTSPWTAYGLGIDASGFIRLETSNGGSYISWDGGVGYRRTPVAGVPTTIVGLYQSSGVSLYFGPDGGGFTASASNPTYSATSTLTLGHPGPTARTSNICIEYGLIFNRRLAPSELKLFRDNPYHWLRPTSQSFALGGLSTSPTFLPAPAALTLTGTTALVGSGFAQLSQLPVEVLVLPDTPVALRVSQAPVEAAILSDAPITARVSQVPVEAAILSDAPITARLSQLPIEVLTVQTYEPATSALSLTGTTPTVVVSVPDLVRVQATPVTTSNAFGISTITVTFPTLPVVGNGVVVYVAVQRTNLSAIPNVTDNQGNAYQLTTSLGASETYASIWHCPTITASSGTFTITVTMSAGTAYMVALAVEVGNVGLGLRPDKTTTASGSSTSPSTGTTAPLTAPCVFQAAVFNHYSGAATITVGAATPSWFEEFQASITYFCSEGDSRIVSAAAGTTASCAWTSDATNDVWVSVLAAFKAGVLEAIVTQAPVEVLSQPVPAARITQGPVEVLSQSVPAARVTQGPVEVLSQPPADPRISQFVVEVLSGPPGLPLGVLEVPTGVLVLTGTTPVATQFAPLIPATGALVFTGQPLVVTSTAKVVPTGALQLLGSRPELLSRIVPAGALVLTGTVPLVLEQTLGTPSETLYAYYATFIKQAETGPQTITGVGFPGKALLIWSTRLTEAAVAGVGTGVEQLLGMTDGITQSARHIRHPGGEAATTSAQNERTDAIVVATSATTGATPTIELFGIFDSWTADGFTINWTVNDGVATIFHVLVMGGPRIEIAVKQIKISIGGGQTLPVHTVGFQPDSYIVMGGAADEFGGSTQNYSLGAPFGSIHGFGFSNGTDNICSWTLGRGTGGAADSYAGLHINRVASIRTANLAGAGELTGVTISANVTDGFVLTRHDYQNGHQPIQHIMCIKGAKFQLGTFDPPAAPGDLNIPLSFPAGLLIAQTHSSTVLDTDGISGLNLMTGTWVNETGQGGTWIGGVDNASPSVYNRATYTGHVIQTRNPTSAAVTCQASVTSVDPTGIVLTFTHTAPMTIIYLALGSVIPGGDECGLFDPSLEDPPGLVWIEFEDYDGNVHVWSEIDIVDPVAYYFGFKASRLLEAGAIQRALSDDTGAHESMAFDFTIDDTLRLLRGLFGSIG